MLGGDSRFCVPAGAEIGQARHGVLSGSDRSSSQVDYSPFWSCTRCIDDRLQHSWRLLVGRKVEIVGIVSALHHCEECATKLAETLRDPDDTEADLIPGCADLAQRLLGRQSHHGGNAPMS